MYERFIQAARRAVFFADREARQAGSPYLEPEHLLLGLTHEADSKANQLFALAAHAESFRKQLEAVAPLKASKPVDVPVSNICKLVLVCSVEEADQLGSRQIGTEHLLLGLLREKKSRVQGTLAAVGIDLHSARNRIRETQGLPILDREPDDKEVSLRPLRPFAGFALLVITLSLLYLIFRLANF